MVSNCTQVGCGVCSIEEPQVCQESIPHTTSSLNHWYKAGWIHDFMSFRPHYDPTIWISQQNVDHLPQALRCCMFRDAILHTWVITSVFFVILGDILFLSYCSSCLSISHSTSLAILLWPLASTRHFSYRTATHWICSLFHTIPYKP